MRIGITYDLKSEYLAMGYSQEEVAEFDREDTVAGIEQALRASGHEPERIGYIRTLTSMLAAGKRWDMVFNIAEGLRGFAREAQVPALLEAFDIPYTGSDPLTLSLTHHKGYTKQIVECAGVNTPPFAVVSVPDDVAAISLPFPLFVKPAAEGTGKGISSASKVNTPAELAAQCRYVLETFKQPALVEMYLPGREFTVGMIGTGKETRVIGVMEILPIEGAESHAYTYFNKENYEEVIRYELVRDPHILDAAAALCIPAWQALGGKDFCRMDVRFDATGRLAFIEVNALPGLNPTHSDLPIICRHVGVPYDTLIAEVVASARSRYQV